jgi:hypothetical protein
MDSIIFPKEFCVDKVTFDTKMRPMENGSKIKYVSYNKNTLIFQTPECFLPYGITNFNIAGQGGNDENSNKYAMDISFKNMDERPSLKKFFEVLKSMDELIVSEAFKNQKDWLKKSHPSKEVVEALYVPMIRYAKDKESGEITDAYPPTFKMKIPYNNDKFLVDFYDFDATTLNGADIVNPEKTNTKGARARAIVKCTGLWFAGGKFGSTWRAMIIQIAPKMNPSGGCAIKMSSEDAMNNESSDDDTDAEHLDDDEEEDY